MGALSTEAESAALDDPRNVPTGKAGVGSRGCATRIHVHKGLEVSNGKCIGGVCEACAVAVLSRELHRGRLLNLTMFMWIEIEIIHLHLKIAWSGRFDYADIAIATNALMVLFFYGHSDP